MSTYQAFRRMAVAPQVAQRFETTTLPAPIRGLVLDENPAFTQPGAANVMDNWMPTLRGAALRGGSILHCDLHALDKYEALWDVAHWDKALWDHTSASLSTRSPVISAFSYISAFNQKMFAADKDRLVDVTAGVTDGDPILVRRGHSSGNYCFSQLSNQGGDWGIAVNDGGDAPMRFDGTNWVALDSTPPPDWVNGNIYLINDRATDTADSSQWKCAVSHVAASSGTFAADRTANPSYWVVDVPVDGADLISGPVGSAVEHGKGLVHVCKYRNRYFFIEQDSMNAWYLPVNAVGGTLGMIPLSGAASLGGKLLFCTSWSIDGGDGPDDKIIFVTDLGEVLVFSGSDPSAATNWRQEGRYRIAPPMGMNAYLALGGDVLIATVPGIIPVSACINKTYEQMELAAITKSIKPMWRDEVNSKRQWPWTMCHWEKYDGIFVTWPGSTPGYCAAVNSATSAWCRFVGYDATCFIKMGDDFYFGTQDGRIMQADRGGTDDGLPYTATLVGGWEMFQSPAQTAHWRQARASFYSSAGQPFQPQLSACTDYVITLPPPPPAGPDPGPTDAWDESNWGPDTGNPPSVPTAPERVQYAQWDQPVVTRPAVRNTQWVSIGRTGFSHAPVVQVTVSQKVKPNVELICISALFERAGINV
jgi:hypothetical protein